MRSPVCMESVPQRRDSCPRNSTERFTLMVEVSHSWSAAQLPTAGRSGDSPPVAVVPTAAAATGVTCVECRPCPAVRTRADRARRTRPPQASSWLAAATQCRSVTSARPLTASRRHSAPSTGHYMGGHHQGKAPATRPTSSHIGKACGQPHPTITKIHHLRGAARFVTQHPNVRSMP